MVLFCATLKRELYSTTTLTRHDLDGWTSLEFFIRNFSAKFQQGTSQETINLFQSLAPTLRNHRREGKTTFELTVHKNVAYPVVTAGLRAQAPNGSGGTTADYAAAVASTRVIGETSGGWRAGSGGGSVGGGGDVGSGGRVIRKLQAREHHPTVVEGEKLRKRHRHRGQRGGQRDRKRANKSSRVRAGREEEGEEEKEEEADEEDDRELRQEKKRARELVGEDWEEDAVFAADEEDDADTIVGDSEEEEEEEKEARSLLGKLQIDESS